MGKHDQETPRWRCTERTTIWPVNTLLRVATRRHGSGPMMAQLWKMYGVGG
jgi:hypothetical protein